MGKLAKNTYRHVSGLFYGAAGNYLNRSALVAFSTERTATPTSAKTAIHICAAPASAKANTSTLIASANVMLNVARRVVRRAIRIACGGK